MELQAFKEAEVLRNPTEVMSSLEAPNLGDLAPKRQWRQPRRTAKYFTEATRKK